jgi:hypothetical protein
LINLFLERKAIMLNDYLEIYRISAVFIGEFNPVIIQPFWLANKKLIMETEAQNAKVEIIHNEIVRFDIGWAKVEITKNRFEIRTSEEAYFEPLKDLAISIFDILKETPITALGINHLKYYALTDADTYYRFGDKLAPLSNWKDVLNDPRMSFFEIIEQKRKDGLKGKFRVRIHGSDVKLSTPYGVLVSLNDHYSAEQGQEREGEMVKLLGNKWKSSMDRSFEIAESIWSKIN